MSTTTCTVCGKPTRDDAYACEDCLTSLAKALGEVPWTIEQLEITQTRQRGLPTEGGPRGTETPLPWHEAASAARKALHGTLSTWVRVCIEEHVRNSSPHALWPKDDPVSMSRWLLWRVDGLAFHEAVGEVLAEIEDAVAQCSRIVDRRPDRWYAGQCTTDLDDGATCYADLYAKARTGVVVCQACKAAHDVEKRREILLAAAEDQLADAATISRAVSWLGAEPLTASRVRKWAERGRILAKGHDGTRPLYRIGDAIDLLARDTTQAG